MTAVKTFVHRLAIWNQSRNFSCYEMKSNKCKMRKKLQNNIFPDGFLLQPFLQHLSEEFSNFHENFKLHFVLNDWNELFWTSIFSSHLFMLCIEYGNKTTDLVHHDTTFHHVILFVLLLNYLVFLYFIYIDHVCEICLVSTRRNVHLKPSQRLQNLIIKSL